MKELAEFLKNERMSRDLTVAALSERSGISVSMLESFESLDFERFGASLLLRNTVRAYCEALDIEAEPLLEKYSSQIEACNTQEAGIKRYGQLRKTLYKRRRMVAVPVFIFFLSSAAVFYGGTWLLKRRSKLYAPPDAKKIFAQENLPVDLQESPAAGAKAKGSKPAPPTPPKAQAAGQTADSAPKAEVGAQKPAVGNAGVAANGGVNQAQASPPKAIVPDETGASAQISPPGAEASPGVVQDAEAHTLNKLTVDADGTVWIEVKIDGQKPHAETLHAGDHREWVAAKGMEVVIGNAGGVKMQWNGQPLAAPHTAGQVLRFRLPDYANRAKG